MTQGLINLYPNNMKVEGVVSGLVHALYVAEQNSAACAAFHFATSGEEENCLLE